MQTDSVLEAIRSQQASGSQVGIAIGSYGLIHAGTLRFLRAARAECDCLYVAVLPNEKLAADTKMAAALLRQEERLRILAMLEEVDGVGEVGETAASLAVWVAAAGKAIWFYSTEENDVDDQVFRILSEVKAPTAISAAGLCTTRALLERIAR